MSLLPSRACASGRASAVSLMAHVGGLRHVQKAFVPSSSMHLHPAFLLYCLGRDCC